MDLNTYPTNNNFLSPLGFKFFVKKLPNVNFFVQSANIPTLSLGQTSIPTPFSRISQPGDHLEYGELNVQFRVDENLANYMELYNWMVGLGKPQSFDQYRELAATHEITADGLLIVLSSAKNPTTEITYYGMYPTRLSEIVFDTKDTEVSYIDATVTFAYQYFTIKSVVNG